MRGFFPDPDQLAKQPLPGDGGHRSYTRLKLPQKSSREESCILMFSGENDPSLKLFVEIQKRLSAAQIPVPRLFRKDLKKGLLLMEDLGDESLESLRLKEGGGASRPFYFQAVEYLVKMQDSVRVFSGDEIFNGLFFAEETDLAVSRLESLLERSLGGISPLQKKKASAPFKKEMNKISSQLEKTFYVFCHRDYHSRNLMINKMLEGGRLSLLDFQDGGSGPMVYDLASLLYDSYVSFQESERKELLKFYFDKLPDRLRKRFDSLSDLDFLTRLQFLQRGFKACGCFAGFYNAEKKRSHLLYIKPTLEFLARTAEDLGFPSVRFYTREIASSLNLSNL